MQTYFFIEVTGPCDSQTNSRTMSSTWSRICTGISERRMAESETPSTSSGSTCNGAGPSSLFSVFENTLFVSTSYVSRQESSESLLSLSKLMIISEYAGYLFLSQFREFSMTDLNIELFAVFIRALFFRTIIILTSSGNWQNSGSYIYILRKSHSVTICCNTAMF